MRHFRQRLSSDVRIGPLAESVGSLCKRLDAQGGDRFDDWWWVTSSSPSVSTIQSS
jgi:hypothetical protein